MNDFDKNRNLENLKFGYRQETGDSENLGASDGTTALGCFLMVVGILTLVCGVLGYFAHEFARGFSKAGWGGGARSFTQYDLWILLGCLGGFFLSIIGGALMQESKKRY